MHASRERGPSVPLMALDTKSITRRHPGPPTRSPKSPDRCRPIWADVHENRTDLRSWPSSATLARLCNRFRRRVGSNLADFDKDWSSSAETGPSSTRFSPTLNDIKPTMLEFGPTRSNSGFVRRRILDPTMRKSLGRKDCCATRCPSLRSEASYT